MKLDFAPEEICEPLADRMCARMEACGIMERIEQAIELAIAQRGLLNKEQAARFLGIEERTLEIWMRAAGDRNGRGVPHLKIGETVRFKLPSLEAWAAQFEVNRVLPKAA